MEFFLCQWDRHFIFQNASPLFPHNMILVSQEKIIINHLAGELSWVTASERGVPKTSDPSRLVLGRALISGTPHSSAVTLHMKTVHG
jgi:hypothetical protein